MINLSLNKTRSSCNRNKMDVTPIVVFESEQSVGVTKVLLGPSQFRLINTEPQSGY